MSEFVCRLRQQGNKWDSGTQPDAPTNGRFLIVAVTAQFVSDDI